MSQPSNNPIVQQLQLLLTGYGYNFYNQKNQMRADDLLVRQKAAGSLSEAGALLANLELAYQRQYIPPATREVPYPSATTMNKLRDISVLRDRINGLASQIRGMAIPTQDRIWWRFRDEQSTLNQLLQFDYGLISRTEFVYQTVRNLNGSAWENSNGSGQFEEMLQGLESTIRDRQRFLQIPG